MAATSKRSRKSLEVITLKAAAIATDGATQADAGTATSTRSPPLLRKSSSTSLLDSSAGAPQEVADDSLKQTPFPKLRRRSSSLQDVNGKAEPRRHSEKSKAKKSGQPNRRASMEVGWNTPKSPTNPAFPQLTAKSQPALMAQASTNGRPKRSKKSGDIELTRPATIEVVMKYQLGQHELKKFKQCFTQIDLDSSGVIDYDEFFEFIDETKTPFSEGLFRMIDSDSNGTIDFEEFVHAMVLYCMYTRDEILQFAFDTFDPAKTGSIGEKEFKRLISVVNDGQPVYPGNFKNALNEFDRNKDGLLDFEEFKIMNKRYPMLLFPCFRLQDRMQKSTLGEHHWLQLHKRLYQKLKLENYQRKNNGALPPLSMIGTIRRFFKLDAMDVYQP